VVVWAEAQEMLIAKADVAHKKCFERDNMIPLVRTPVFFMARL